jgi:hypothetical protein
MKSQSEVGPPREGAPQTDQQSPAVGSLTKGLLINTDGSVDVHFGPKAPAGKENNWVQTIPGKGMEYHSAALWPA